MKMKMKKSTTMLGHLHLEMFSCCTAFRCTYSVFIIAHARARRQTEKEKEKLTESVTMTNSSLFDNSKEAYRFSFYFSVFLSFLLSFFFLFFFVRFSLFSSFFCYLFLLLFCCCFVWVFFIFSPGPSPVERLRHTSICTLKKIGKSAHTCNMC